MPRLESPVGGKRDARITNAAKKEAQERDKRLRAARDADGYMPGQVPIRDPRMQRARLEQLEAAGGLTMPEQRQLTEFRRQQDGPLT